MQLFNAPFRASAIIVCATLVVATVAAPAGLESQEIPEIVPRELQGLPHGLAPAARLRTAAHHAAHEAVMRHVGRRASDASRLACDERAKLLRDLVSAGSLEAAVDLSLSLEADVRGTLPKGCVLEDRPHAGFAEVVTKVQREGANGVWTSHVRVSPSAPFATVVPVGSRAFSGSQRQAPVVGFELDRRFYLAESALRCDRAAGEVSA